MIAVDIVMRSDHATTFGGDVVQVQRYIEHLPAGFDVRVLGAGRSMRLRSNAVVHIVNVDRPWDLLEASHQAGRRPLVISTIHHDLARVRRIGTRRSRSLRRGVDAVVPTASLDLAKRIYRGRSWPQLGRVGVGAFISASALRRRVGRVLERADSVLVLADGERRVIESDFACRLRNAVVLPNGIPELRVPADVSSRDIPILIPGRIEPRKNQVALAEALARSGTEATFLGAPHPREERYVAAFRDLVDRSPNMGWIPGVPPQAMGAWYQRARVVLNLSLVEVLSLVDLEAYGAGCRLVTTVHGHTREWLGGAATYVDPDAADQAVAAAAQLVAMCGPATPDPDLLARMSWPHIGDQLARVYRSVSAVVDSPRGA